MAERPTRAQVEEWLSERPTATAAELCQAFPGLSKGTGYRWFAARGQPRRPSGRRPSVKELGQTPVEQMAVPDRDRALGIVRKTYSALAILAERMFEEVKGGATELDRDTAQAALSWQRMAAGIVEAHPGLLALEKGEAQGVEPIPTEDELEEILVALGVEAGPEEP